MNRVKPELMLAALAYHDRGVEDELSIFDLTRRQIGRILRASPPEAWERTGVVGDRGDRTVGQMINGAVEHLAHHLGFVIEKRRALVGMEDTLKRELPRLGIAVPPIKANTGSQPLLHIIRELRNLEFHLHSSPLSVRQRSALWGNLDKPSEATQIDLRLWVIDDLTEAQFRQLANAKYYQPGDIAQLVAWFNAAQKEWGVDQLIFMAVEAFCYSIIATYSLPPS